MDQNNKYILHFTFQFRNALSFAKLEDVVIITTILVEGDWCSADWKMHNSKLFCIRLIKRHI